MECFLQTLSILVLSRSRRGCRRSSFQRWVAGRWPEPLFIDNTYLTDSNFTIVLPEVLNQDQAWIAISGEITDAYILHAYSILPVKENVSHYWINRHELLSSYLMQRCQWVAYKCVGVSHSELAETRISRDTVILTNKSISPYSPTTPKLANYNRVVIASNNG